MDLFSVWVASIMGMVHSYFLLSSSLPTIILSRNDWSYNKTPSSILALDDLDSSPHLAKKLEEVSAETIEDKSKGDALSKMFSILQISWFIVQCITRAIQHLPITLLEVTALAFAGLSIITYCLWWNKPLNIKYHISLDGSESRTFRLTQETTSTGFWGVLFGIANIIMGESDDERGYDGIGHGAVRFSSCGGGKKSTRFAILVGVGSLFGAFHCAAWSFSFASHTEMVLWRFSSLAMLIVVFIAAFFPVMAVWAFQGLDSMEPQTITHSETEYKVWDAFYYFVLVVIVLAYIVARIMLIILAFMQLRSLPPLAFHTVQWTTYMPHI